MKRFHVHLSVANLDSSTLFYNELFGQQPSLEQPDYVKWLLDDPMINFAISNRSQTTGLDHFGFQAANPIELSELKQRAEAATGHDIQDEGQTTCCYANSEKHWATDPNGIAWEHYHTMSTAQTYGETPSQPMTETASEANSEQTACCATKAAPSHEGKRCC